MKTLFSILAYVIHGWNTEACLPDADPESTDSGYNIDDFSHVLKS